MKIYELHRCEEYWMQESCGLFETKEKAVKDVINPILTLEVDDMVFIITENDYRDPPSKTQVIAQDGTVVTKENFFDDYADSYQFYDIIHNGYDIYGVYPREVK